MNDTANETMTAAEKRVPEEHSKNPHKAVSPSSAAAESCAARTSAEPPSEEGTYEVWHVDNPNLAKEREVYEKDGELVVDVPKDSLAWAVDRRDPTVEEYDTKWHRWRGPLAKAKA